jgi:hypothetical protein
MTAAVGRILAGFSEIAGQRRGGNYVDRSIRASISLTRIRTYGRASVGKTAAIKFRIACQASRIVYRDGPARFNAQSWRSTESSQPTNSAGCAAAGGVAA